MTIADILNLSDKDLQNLQIKTEHTLNTDLGQLTEELAEHVFYTSQFAMEYYQNNQDNFSSYVTAYVSMVTLRVIMLELIKKELFKRENEE